MKRLLILLPILLVASSCKPPVCKNIPVNGDRSSGKTIKVC